MSDANIPRIRLNDGTDLPAVGFGTYQLTGSTGVASMVSAIKQGYRLLDSAVNYENEGALGVAIQQAAVAREQLRITSKLPGRHHACEQALTCIEESLYRSKLEYFDLYLIHWPNPLENHYVEAWSALIEARQRGWVRSIGVCNFLPEHLEQLIAKTGVTPSVNQIELHPYFPQQSQREWNRQRGIITQSWSPLARAKQLANEPVLQLVAAEVGKTLPQVVLRWHYQLGALAVPKAASASRQTENLAIFDFELSPQQMEAIASLARVDGRIADQDPARYQEF